MTALRTQVNDPLLDPRQVGEMLGLSAYTVREKARKRELPAIRLGKFWRFRESALRAWIEQQERPAR